MSEKQTASDNKANLKRVPSTTGDSDTGFNAYYGHGIDEDVLTVYFYECSLKWGLVRPISDATVSQARIVTPSKAKRARGSPITMTQWVRGDFQERSNSPEPATFISNAAMVTLLKSFDKGFKAALLGLETIFPEAGEQSVMYQRMWEQNVLTQGIKELENCDTENIIWFCESDIVQKIPTYRNSHFKWLLHHLKETCHYAITYDIHTGNGKPEEAYYHVVVKHGEFEEIGEEVTYHLYGTSMDK